MIPDHYIKFIDATKNMFTVEQLMDMVIDMIKKYQAYKSDANRIQVANFCMLLLVKVLDVDLVDMHEVFKHFTAFQELTNTINKKENQ